MGSGDLELPCAAFPTGALMGSTLYLGLPSPCRPLSVSSLGVLFPRRSPPLSHRAPLPAHPDTLSGPGRWFLVGNHCRELPILA